MKLPVFDKQNKSELSMIEVAYEILKANQNEMSFKDLYKEIGKYLGKTKKDLDKSIVDFYTDLNVDGSFISLGNDIWGLRDWYPFESVDEETNHNEDVKEMSDKSSSNYDEDDDVIDYIETDEDSESTSTATTSITDQFSSSTLESDNFLDDDEENQVEEDPQSAEEDLSDFSEDDDTDDDDDDL